MEEVVCSYKHRITGQEIRGYRIQAGEVVRGTDLYDAEKGWRECVLLAELPLPVDLDVVVIRPVSY